MTTRTCALRNSLLCLESTCDFTDCNALVIVDEIRTFPQFVAGTNLQSESHDQNLNLAFEYITMRFDLFARQVIHECPTQQCTIPNSRNDSLL